MIRLPLEPVHCLQGYIGKRIRFRKLFWSDHHVYISSWSTSSSQSIIWYSSFENYIVKMVVFGNKISLQIVIKWSSWHPGSMLQRERAREREKEATDTRRWRNTKTLLGLILTIYECVFVCFVFVPLGKSFSEKFIAEWPFLLQTLLFSTTNDWNMEQETESNHFWP